MARVMPLLSGLNFSELVQAFDFASETPVRQYSGLGTAKSGLLDHPDVLIGSEFRKPSRFQNPKPSWPALCGPSTSLWHGRQERKTWMTRQKSLKEGRVMTVKFGIEN
ncbi:hypothetical protein [Parvibaculum sp.]|uniref:hypothetical protein n=1 Tax=Parvibaculum sp. TaxID=2024848 RepID=UPI0038B2FAC8